MGTVFEELIRRFNEENNEEAGERFTPRDVVKLMAKLLFLPIADRDTLDPILDACVAEYIGNLDGQAQVQFKGNAKAFERSYGFLAAILPYGHLSWEKLSIFLNFLIPKRPAPKKVRQAECFSRIPASSAIASMLD